MSRSIDAAVVQEALRMALCHYATRQEARDDVLDYLEMFYNSTRLHSSLGYVSPNDFERVAKVA